MPLVQAYEQKITGVAVLQEQLAHYLVGARDVEAADGTEVDHRDLPVELLEHFLDPAADGLTRPPGHEIAIDA